MNVIISAYAVSPYKGSEPGVGWNWVVAMSEYCLIDVITESEFKEAILREHQNIGLADRVQWHFIDIGAAARRRCWNQGNWLFYLDYRRWQRACLEKAKAICSSKKVAVVHHLNMNGYREPGFLWETGVPFVLGPIGGFGSFHLKYLKKLGLRDKCYQLVRNLINTVQLRTHRRFYNALNSAQVVLAATGTDAARIGSVSGRKITVMNETGVSSVLEGRMFDHQRPLLVSWCGKNASRKCLTLAFDVFVLAIRSNSNIRLSVIGVGESELTSTQLKIYRSCNDAIQLHGVVPAEVARSEMANSDVLLFTSVLEGTPHVVLEALSQGVPVVCHDAFGQGDVVDDTCGIKVPLISYDRSVELMSSAITSLANSVSRRVELSNGARQRAGQFHWRLKAADMYKFYQYCESKGVAPCS